MISKIYWIFSTERGYKANKENTTLPIYGMYGNVDKELNVLRSKHWHHREGSYQSYNRYINNGSPFTSGTSKLVIHYD